MMLQRHLLWLLVYSLVVLSFILSGCSCNGRLDKAGLADRRATLPADAYVERLPSPVIPDIPSDGQVSGEHPAPDPSLTACDAPLKAPLENARIVISKRQRKLFLYAGEKVVRVYPAKIGRNANDDKVRQGDNCTPEGRFYICTKNPRSKFHLSMGISYPNIEDAERGLRNGLIDRKQYEAIVKRNKRRTIPPWNTPLGGEIFIHGEGEIWDFTYGCVAIANRHIDELFSVIPVGTAVEITK